MPSSEIYRRIRDGGLPGLDKPLSLPQRSFYRILARTRKKMAAGTLLKPDPAAPEGEGFIAMLARIDDYPPDRAAAARAEWDREQARLSGRPSESPENSADRTARTAG
jgi:hypothetical protein